MHTKNDSKSLLLFLSAMFIYGSIGVFRRLIPLGSGTLACFRGGCGAALLLLLLKLQGRKLSGHIGRKRFFLLALSGAVMGFNWILLFEAYNYTSVATATLCYYMEPTIVVLLSPLLFGESITLRKGLCALAAVIGMVFVSGLPESGIPGAAETRGILLGLGAALLYAFVVILNKKLPGIDAYEKTIIQLASAAVVLLPYVILSHEQPTADITMRPVFLLLIVGIVHTGIAYAFYFGSMDGLNAQTIALFSYVDPVTALLLSALLLREPLSPLGLAGAVLIIGAALVSEWQFHGK